MYKVLVWGHEFGSNEHIGSICDPTIFMIVVEVIFESKVMKL